MEDEYLIPQEIKSATALGRGLFLMDLFIIGMVWLVMSLFQNAVDDRMQMVYTVCNVALAFIFTRRSSKNPGKRLFESLLFSFMKRKDNRYHFDFYDQKQEVKYEEE